MIIVKIATIIIGVVTLCMHSMDLLIPSLPNDITFTIIKHIPLSLIGNKTPEKIPSALYAKKQFQMITSLHLINNTWSTALTVPRRCVLANLDSAKLAQFECQRAGNIGLVHTQLDNNRTKDQTLNKEVYNLSHELENQFKAIEYFLKNKIIDPNLMLSIDKHTYLNALDEDICQIEEDDQNPLCNSTETVTVSLLHYAVRCGAHTKFTELLLNAGADVHLDIYDHTIRTPLYVDVLYSTGKNAYPLLAKGADLNAIDNDGNTLSHSLVLNDAHAHTPKVRQGALQLLQMLGADCAIPDKDGNTLATSNLNFLSIREIGIKKKITVFLIQGIMNMFLHITKKKDAV